jgi:26S proteasome regulatory subunit (ATPase 3-interacting protein)
VNYSSNFPGKQIVYHALQDPKDAVTPEEIAVIDQEIATLREEISTAKAEEKLLRAKLVVLNGEKSLSDLQASTSILETTKKMLLARLGPLRSGSVRPVSLNEKKEVEAAWNKWSKCASTRKKICMEMWAQIMEVLPEGKTQEEFWEELGLERDE